MNTSSPSLPGFLSAPTRFLFFTGKGGVGKTSLSTAAAIALADAGRRVLLVSTDAASNLDEMLGIPLRNQPVAVPGVANLSVLNIDPDAAAEAYRLRVLAQLEAGASDDERATVREQLSGACTTEIAAFDEFAALLAGEGGHPSGQATHWDHVIFDTAPTGHTLRLLSLPKAWSGFLAGNDRGASCLGPHSGLKMQEARFNAALAALSDARLTTVVLVTRPDPRPMLEAGRTAEELHMLGLTNQRLIINGVFHASRPDDPTARAIETLGVQAIAQMPDALAALPRDEVPLRVFDTVGLSALRALLGEEPVSSAPHFQADLSMLKGQSPEAETAVQAVGAVGVVGASRDKNAPAALGDGSAPADLIAEPLGHLADELAALGQGLIMVMGKGGVGKTTIASALAVGLVQRGHSVHLTTTDPAAHVAETLNGSLPNLKVGRIDPHAETAAYIAKIMATRGKALDEPGRALLLEDLQSPCTEEVAVFHAFSRVVNEARSAFVVLDTAPTGHSLLLMDATGAYHRQMLQQYDSGTGGKGGAGGASGANAMHIITPLMRLQDASMTHVILVTLPEVTPVSQAAALQEDLRRAKIEPWAWVINKSVAATGTTDPLLQARLAGEHRQTARIANGLARRTFVLPWLPESPVGVQALGALTAGAAPSS
ncbi:MAG: TRC40/GET3/ArsA family transport-energizing ATPase [Pseudomonadota bacterium]|nr:TRC40/GET3/ArsA family transport-energizing ATPase [Pseudomonadota bacterium]